MKPRVIGLALLILAALLILFFTSVMRFPPEIPRDADHRRGQAPRQCLSCHGPEGKSPRGANHPLGQQCYQCHQ